VPPLTAQEMPEFVRGLRPGAEPDPLDLARWHAQSGGNPLFLERMVRGAGRPPPRDARSTPGEDELPERTARQLADLPPDEARVLSVAAVLGHAFPFQLLWSATGEEEERLTEEVEGLVARGLLREGADEGLEFVHEELRSRLYATLTVSRRRILHRKAGEALENQGSADPSTVYALALHSFLGRLDERAAVYNRAAADLAIHQGSPTVARLHLERALEAHRRAHPSDATGELELLLELAVQLDRLGELREADRLLSEALQRPTLRDAASPAQRALASLYRARILTDQGRWGEADQLTQELLGSADVRAGPETLLRAHRIRGELLYYRGDYPQALQHHEEALRLAHRLRDDREIALEMVRKANVLGMMAGGAEEAIAAYQLAAETLVRIGDLGEAAYATLFLGVVESQNGELEAGIDHLRKALTLAEEGHDPRRTGWARFNLADMERERGRLEIARRHNQKALETLTEVGDRFGLLQVQIIAGKIALAAGELAPAELALLEGFRLARELQTPADEIEVLLRLAEVALARGDPAGARSRLEQAEKIGLARRPDLAFDVEKLRASLGGEASGAATPGS
jgi:tetratricopeptide (TPR) repeat protein